MCSISNPCTRDPTTRTGGENTVKQRVRKKHVYRSICFSIFLWWCLSTTLLVQQESKRNMGSDFPENPRKINNYSFSSQNFKLRPSTLVIRPLISDLTKWTHSLSNSRDLIFRHWSFRPLNRRIVWVWNTNRKQITLDPLWLKHNYFYYTFV